MRGPAGYYRHPLTTVRPLIGGVLSLAAAAAFAIVRGIALYLAPWRTIETAYQNLCEAFPASQLRVTNSRRSTFIQESERLNSALGKYLDISAQDWGNSRRGNRQNYNESEALSGELERLLRKMPTEERVRQVALLMARLTTIARVSVQEAGFVSNAKLLQGIAWNVSTLIISSIEWAERDGSRFSSSSIEREYRFVRMVVFDFASAVTGHSAEELGDDSRFQDFDVSVADLEGARDVLERMIGRHLPDNIGEFANVPFRYFVERALDSSEDWNFEAKRALEHYRRQRAELDDDIVGGIERT